jgi:hypothetical protein
MRSQYVRLALLALAVVLSSLTSYSLGKDCGAWEAKRRLEGDRKPAMCFGASPEGGGRAGEAPTR